MWTGDVTILRCSSVQIKCPCSSIFKLPPITSPGSPEALLDQLQISTSSSALLFFLLGNYYHVTPMLFPSWYVYFLSAPPYAFARRRQVGTLAMMGHKCLSETPGSQRELRFPLFNAGGSDRPPGKHWFLLFAWEASGIEVRVGTWSQSLG